MNNIYAVLSIYFLAQCTLCTSQESSNLDQYEELNLAIAEHVMSQANKPIWFSLQNPTNPFIGRIAEINELKWGQIDNKITIITGIRGVGKTELTRKYIQEVKHDNISNILWINANTHEELINSFKDLAIQIGNSLESKSMTTILRETFSFFYNKKSLFILDHASSDNIIIKNLQTFLGVARKINVIVTTRDENWDESYKILKLKPFTKENSLEYLKIVLRKEINMNIIDTSAEKVSELLKYLPLALSKATQYIIQKNTMLIDGEYNIDNYIKDLLKYQQPNEPLITTTPMPTDREIEKSLLDKIKEEKDRILNQIRTETLFAWEKITEESNKVGSQLTNEAGKTGKQLTNQTAKITKLFSIG